MWNKKLKIWIIFQVSLHMTWDIWAQFPQIAQIPEYLWNRYSSTQRALTLEQGLIWCETRSRRLWITCHVFLDMIWSIQGHFPQIAKYPSTCEIGIGQPTEGCDTRARSHLMWIKEMKILDYFPCVPAHDLGYSGPVSQNCTNIWVPVKRV